MKKCRDWGERVPHYTVGAGVHIGNVGYIAQLTRLMPFSASDE